MAALYRGRDALVPYIGKPREKRVTTGHLGTWILIVLLTANKTVFE
jgi:hypothetical protein